MLFQKILSFSLLTLLSLSAGAGIYGTASHITRQGARWDADNMVPQFEVLKPTRFQWMRTDFDWVLIEKNGKWDFSNLDRCRDEAKKAGIHLLPILGYSGPGGIKAWEHPDRWLEYVRKTVSRYKNDFRYWEVYNEENLLISGKQYAEFLKKTYLEIKKVDPDLQVVSGGTMPIPIPWLEEFFQAGGTSAFDVLAIHPYAFFEVPEQNIPRYRKLHQLMEQYGVGEKPVWVTEFGWSTCSPPKLQSKIVKAALEYLKIDPSKIPLACVYDIQAVVPPSVTALFKNTVCFGYSDLKTLDPKRYPVLMPRIGENFPAGAHAGLLEYVRKGGIVLSLWGIPFYYELLDDGAIQRQVNGKYRPQFHIDVDTWWTKEGVPKHADTCSVTPEFSAVLQLDKQDVFRDRGRFLSPANLKPGDKLIPMIMGSTKDFKAPLCGIYQFNSSLKGAMVLFCDRFGMNSVSEDYQAAYLVRSGLIAAACGIQGFFFYNLRSGEYGPENSEAHYGLLRRDLSPKPSFIALNNLFRLFPEQSTPPVLKHCGKVWTANWKKPDGKTVWAIWSEFPEAYSTISVLGQVSAAYDMAGKKIGFTPGRKTITFAPIYVEGPTAVIITE